MTCLSIPRHVVFLLGWTATPSQVTTHVPMRLRIEKRVPRERWISFVAYKLYAIMCNAITTVKVSMSEETNEAMKPERTVSGDVALPAVYGGGNC